jgi:chromosome segregation ATPase
LNENRIPGLKEGSPGDEELRRRIDNLLNDLAEEGVRDDQSLAKLRQEIKEKNRELAALQRKLSLLRRERGSLVLIFRSLEKKLQSLAGKTDEPSGPEKT